MVKLELDEKRTHEIMMPSSSGGGMKQKVVELVIAGRGDPHIVLLSGYGVGVDYSWAKIFSELKARHRVIAHNRWGVGRSASTGTPQTGKEIIGVLRKLLSIEEVHKPYVLVGHSIGGVYAQLFAQLYPKEVGGVVLVESAHPDQLVMKKACKEGLGRRALDGTLDWLDYTINPRRHSEITNFEETAQQIRDAPPFPPIPLVVVSAGIQPPGLLVGKKYRQVLEENQQKLVELSPLGRQVIAENSRHFVQNDEPEVILKAIQDVADEVRGNPETPTPTRRTIDFRAI